MHAILIVVYINVLLHAEVDLSGDVTIFKRLCTSRDLLNEEEVSAEALEVGCHDISLLSPIMGNTNGISNLQGQYCFCEEEVC